MRKVDDDIGRGVGDAGQVAVDGIETLRDIERR
jgi:hypothetical protein